MATQLTRLYPLPSLLPSLLAHSLSLSVLLPFFLSLLATKLDHCVPFTTEGQRLFVLVPLRFLFIYFIYFSLLFSSSFPLSSQSMEWVKSMENSNISMGERKALLMNANKALKRQLIESMAGKKRGSWGNGEVPTEKSDEGNNFCNFFFFFFQ